jgi:hypothetical protein
VLFLRSNQIWRSIDEGTTWTTVDDRGLEGRSLLSVGVAGDHLFGVSENYGVFRFNAEVAAIESERR